MNADAIRLKTYPKAVRFTWFLTLGVYALTIFLIPIREPVGKTIMWDLVMGLFAAAAALGYASHLTLRFVFPREGHPDPADHPKLQVLMGFVWITLLGVIFFSATSFVFAIWAAI
jgi:hypothetical protein